MTRTRADIIAEYRQRIQRDGDGPAAAWLYNEQDSYPGGWMAPDKITGRRESVTWTGASYGVYHVERY